MAQAFLALGSNLHNPITQVQNACHMLQQQSHIELIAVSPLYRNPPVGLLDQPDFINAVVKLETSLSPEQLLEHCLNLENHAGRRRTVRNAPRTLDIDIILYDDIVLDKPELQIPHPRAFERNFVVIPLWQIAPDLILPNGMPLAEIAQNIATDSLILLSYGDEQ